MSVNALTADEYCERVEVELTLQVSAEQLQPLLLRFISELLALLRAVETNLPYILEMMDHFVHQNRHLCRRITPPIIWQIDRLTDVNVESNWLPSARVDTRGTLTCIRASHAFVAELHRPEAFTNSMRGSVFDGGHEISLLQRIPPIHARADASVKRRHTPGPEADPLSWSSGCGVLIGLAQPSQEKEHPKRLDARFLPTT